MIDYLRTHSLTCTRLKAPFHPDVDCKECRKLMTDTLESDLKTLLESSGGNNGKAN